VIARQVTDVQQAFIEEGGVQCGFCTPGLIVAVHHLLDKNPDPTELQVKESISGNICRCTGYGRIFAAVEAVVQVRKVSG
jgi:carbon-monoxide dehydrogenase small subunit